MYTTNSINWQFDRELALEFVTKEIGPKIYKMKLINFLDRNPKLKFFKTLKLYYILVNISF